MTMQTRMRMDPDEARMLYHIEKEKRQPKLDALIDEARGVVEEGRLTGAGTLRSAAPKRASKADGHHCNKCWRTPEQTKFHRIKQTKSGLSGSCVDCIRRERAKSDMESGRRKRERFIVSGPHLADRQWCVEDTKRENPMEWRPTRTLARQRRDELNGSLL